MVHLRPSKNMKYYVSLSGFPKGERVILSQQIKKLGGKYLPSRSFQRDCTHLICGTLMRCEKYLGACITGTWILSKKFIQDSHEVGKWLDESHYEFSVLDASQPRHLVEAAKRWRWKIENYNEYPFSEWSVACIMDPVLKDAFERLFRAGGATVEQVNFPLTQENIPNVTYVLMDPASQQYAAILQDFGILCLSYEFLSEFVIKENSDPFDYVIKGDCHLEPSREVEPLDASIVIGEPSSVPHDASIVIGEPSSVQHDASIVIGGPSSVQHDASIVIGGPSSVQHDAREVSSLQSHVGRAGAMCNNRKEIRSLYENAGEEYALAHEAESRTQPECSHARNVRLRRKDAGVSGTTRQYGNCGLGATKLKVQQASEKFTNVKSTRGKRSPMEKRAKPASESPMVHSAPDSLPPSAFSCDTIGWKIHVEDHAEDVPERRIVSELPTVEKSQEDHGKPNAMCDEKQHVQKRKRLVKPIAEINPNVPVTQHQKNLLGVEDRKRKKGDVPTDGRKKKKVSHERKTEKSKSASETSLKKPGAANVNGEALSQDSGYKSLCSRQLFTAYIPPDTRSPADPSGSSNSGPEDNYPEIPEKSHGKLAKSPGFRNVQEKFSAPPKCSLEKKPTVNTKKNGKKTCLTSNTSGATSPLVSLSLNVYLYGLEDSDSKPSASELEKDSCDRTVSDLNDDPAPSPVVRSPIPINTPDSLECGEQRGVTSPSSEYKSTASGVASLRPNIYLYGLDCLTSNTKCPSVPQSERDSKEKSRTSSSATITPTVNTEHNSVHVPSTLPQPKSSSMSGEIDASKISTLAESRKTRHRFKQKKRKSSVQSELKTSQSVAEHMETFSSQPVKGCRLSKIHDNEDDRQTKHLSQPSVSSNSKRQGRKHFKRTTDIPLKDGTQLTKSGKKFVQSTLQGYFGIKSHCSADNATRSERKSFGTEGPTSGSFTEAEKGNFAGSQLFLTTRIKEKIDEPKTFLPGDVTVPNSGHLNVFGPNFSKSESDIVEIEGCDSERLVGVPVLEKNRLLSVKSHEDVFQGDEAILNNISRMDCTDRESNNSFSAVEVCDSVLVEQGSKSVGKRGKQMLSNKIGVPATIKSSQKTSLSPSVNTKDSESRQNLFDGNFSAVPALDSSAILKTASQTEYCDVSVSRKLIKKQDVASALDAVVQVEVLPEEVIKAACSPSKRHTLERGQVIGNNVGTGKKYEVTRPGNTEICGKSSSKTCASTSLSQDQGFKRSLRVFEKREKKSIEKTSEDDDKDPDFDKTASQSAYVPSIESDKSSVISHHWPFSVPLAPSEGYQDKNAVHVLVGQFTEVSRELGHYAVALNHARPSCARQPTALVLTELLQLAQCEEEELQNLAFSYLMAWLELHPPVTPMMVQVYASVMGIKPNSSFLMDLLSVVNQSGNKGRKQLWTYVLSVFEVNFSHCLQNESEKSVQGCLLVQWLWAHHRAVHHNQKSRWLLALVNNIFSQDSVDITICLPICRLVGLVAECIRLAGVGWNLRDPSFLKDCVLALVHDFSKIFHDINSVSRHHFVYTLLQMLAPSWFRALMTAAMLSSLNQHLLIDDINVRNLSLATIVSQFFFLLPRLEKRDDDLAKFPELEEAEKPPMVLCQKKMDTNTKVGQGKYTTARVNKKNKYGENMVHKAAKKNDFKTMTHILSIPGVNLNQKDNHGWTPLHEACNHGSLECVELLLKFVPPITIKSFFPSSGKTLCGPVDLTAVSDDGITALHDAVLQNHVDVCRLMLKYGGKRLLLTKTQEGKTALDLAQTEEMKNALTISDQEYLQDVLNQSLDSETGERTVMPLPAMYQGVLQGGTLLASFSHCVSYLTLLGLLLSSYAEAMCQGHTRAMLGQGDARVAQNIKDHLRAFKKHVKNITRQKDYVALKPYLLMVAVSCGKLPDNDAAENNS